MQISPINKTSFNGRFQRTPVLEKILHKADKNSVGKFNEIVKRAAEVNDGLLFKITDFTALQNKCIYHLYKNDSAKKSNVILKSITVSQIGNRTKESEVLSNFLPTLEQYYPSTYSSSKEELISSINKNLID